MLSEMQQAFCRHYVANNGDGNDAAIKAGYSKNSARVQASQMLRRPDIQAEIERIKAENRSTARSLVAMKPLEGTIYPPGTPRPTIDPANRAKVEEAVFNVLCRDWVVSRLMRNVRLSMGEEKSKITRVITHTIKAHKDPVTGEEVPTTKHFEMVELEIFERDPVAANTGLMLLSRELNELEIAGIIPRPAPPDHTAAEVVERSNPALEKSLAGYHDIMARMNAAEPVNPKPNGAMNGKGNGVHP